MANDPEDTSAHLRRYGPCTFRELLTVAHRASFSMPGVYLWIDDLQPPERISYVGQALGAPDLWKRQWSHYASYIAGHYQLPGAARFDSEPWELDSTRDVVVGTMFDEEKYVRFSVRSTHSSLSLSIRSGPSESLERQSSYSR